MRLTLQHIATVARHLTGLPAGRRYERYDERKQKMNVKAAAQHFPACGRKYRTT